MSDGRPERSEIAPDPETLHRMRNKRNMVMRCTDELREAVLARAKAKKTWQDLDTRIAELEDELDAFIGQGS